jgi:hypothetical protein
LRKKEKEMPRRNPHQRYRMPKRVSVEIVGNVVLITLECGHNYRLRPYWHDNDPAQYEAALAAMLTSAQEHLGLRERCNKCWPAVEGFHSPAHDPMHDYVAALHDQIIPQGMREP